MENLSVESACNPKKYTSMDLEEDLNMKVLDEVKLRYLETQASAGAEGRTSNIHPYATILFKFSGTVSKG